MDFGVFENLFGHVGDFNKQKSFWSFSYFQGFKILKKLENLVSR
jgi:hypothetical protein